MAEKLYTVESTGAGRFAKGETFTEEEYGEFLPKAIRTGGVREATPEEVKAYRAAKESGDETLPLQRSAALATGDQDAVNAPVEQPAPEEKKGK